EKVVSILLPSYLGCRSRFRQYTNGFQIGRRLGLPKGEPSHRAPRDGTRNRQGRTVGAHPRRVESVRRKGSASSFPSPSLPRVSARHVCFRFFFFETLAIGAERAAWRDCRLRAVRARRPSHSKKRTSDSPAESTPIARVAKLNAPIPGSYRWLCQK